MYEKDSPKCDKGIFGNGKPVLGICYGLQLMANELGDKIEHKDIGKYGEGKIILKKKDTILEGLDKKKKPFG